MEQLLRFNGPVDNEIHSLFGYIYAHPVTGKHIPATRVTFVLDTLCAPLQYDSKLECNPHIHDLTSSSNLATSG